jgi:transposase
VSKHPVGRPWSKYSPEFKRAAVDRLAAGESPAALERELGIRRKFLYEWKAAGKGSQSAPAPVEAAPDPQQPEIERLQQKLAEFQQLAGRQAAELDFLAAALRSIKEGRRNSGAPSGDGSTK